MRQNQDDPRQLLYWPTAGCIIILIINNKSIALQH